jgi:hypothetical protein
MNLIHFREMLLTRNLSLLKVAVGVINQQIRKLY